MAIKASTLKLAKAFSTWLVRSLIGMHCVTASAAAAPQVVYVAASAQGENDGSSWANAYPDLNSAIASSVTGSQIWVAEGIYRPDGGTKSTQSSFMLRDGISIIGGFEGTEKTVFERDLLKYHTVLSGDLAENDDGTLASKTDNCMHVVQAQGVGQSALLDGVTVRGGVGGPGAGASGTSGGGLWIIDASPRMYGVTFENNKANGGGGVYQRIGNPTFEYCKFVDNQADQAGALFNNGAGTTHLIGCLFIGNESTFQGTIRCDNGGGFYIQGCTFISNVSVFGAGVLSANTSVPIVISRSRFISNSGLSSSAFLVSGISNNGLLEPVILSIDNSEFIGNTASAGGVIVATTTSSVNVIRSTFYENNSGTAGSCIKGVQSFGSVTLLSIRDSVLWSNSGAGITSDLSQVSNDPLFTSVDHSCIEGLTGAYAGDGQIDRNPIFRDPIGADGVPGTVDDDLRLGSTSTLIDAGTFDEAYGLDVDGSPRWIDGNLDRKLRLDMGAHEFNNVELTVTMRGSVIDVSVVGAPGLVGMILVGQDYKESLNVPFGSTFIDFQSRWARWLLGPLPVSFKVPEMMPTSIGNGLVLQVLGFKRTSIGHVGNWSNPVQLGALPSQAKF